MDRLISGHVDRTAGLRQRSYDGLGRHSGPKAVSNAFDASSNDGGTYSKTLQLRGAIAQSERASMLRASYQRSMVFVGWLLGLTAGAAYTSLLTRFW